jgi:hypothetical protein
MDPAAPRLRGNRSPEAALWQPPPQRLSRRGWALLSGLVFGAVCLGAGTLEAQSPNQVQVAAAVQPTPARPLLDLALASAAAARALPSVSQVRETSLAQIRTQVVPDREAVSRRRLVVSVVYVRN